MEAEKANLRSFGREGGLILDEMSIQVNRVEIILLCAEDKLFLVQEIFAPSFRQAPCRY